MKDKETGSLEGLTLGLLALLSGIGVGVYELFWGRDPVVGVLSVILAILGAVAINRIEG